MAYITKVDDFEGAEVIEREGTFVLDTNEFVSGAQSLSSGQDATVSPDYDTPSATVAVDITGAQSVSFMARGVIDADWNYETYASIKVGATYRSAVSGDVISGPASGAALAFSANMPAFELFAVSQDGIDAANDEAHETGDPVEMIIYYYLWSSGTGHTFYIDDLTAVWQEGVALVNNFGSTLATAIGEVDTSLTLASDDDKLGLIHPGRKAILTLYEVDPETEAETHREIVYVTARGDAAGELIVEREQEGTTTLAGGWPISTPVAARVTQGMLGGLQDATHSNEAQLSDLDDQVSGTGYRTFNVGTLDMSSWDSQTTTIPGGTLHVDKVTLLHTGNIDSPIDLTDPAFGGRSVPFDGVMRVSPGDTYLAYTLSDSPYVAIFTISTHAEQTLLTTPSGCKDIAFSPADDTLFLATPTDGFAAYEVSTWDVDATFGTKPTANGLCVDVSPDGTVLAVGLDGDGFLKLYDTSDGSEIAATYAPAGNVDALRFTTGGDHLLLAIGNEVVALDTAAWDVVRTLYIDDTAVGRIFVHATQDLFAVRSAGSAGMLLFDGVSLAPTALNLSRGTTLGSDMRATCMAAVDSYMVMGGNTVDVVGLAIGRADTSDIGFDTVLELPRTGLHDVWDVAVTAGGRAYFYLPFASGEQIRCFRLDVSQGAVRVRSDSPSASPQPDLMPKSWLYKAQETGIYTRESKGVTSTTEVSLSVMDQGVGKVDVYLSGVYVRA